LTILELATDLDVPHGGDAWQLLRSGEFPRDLQHNLSNDLVRIITQMINPDPQQRPTVTDLLNFSSIQRVINGRHNKIVKHYNIKVLVKFSTALVHFLSVIGFFIFVFPIKKLLNFNSLNGYNNILHQTSTPNRDMQQQNSLQVSLSLMDMGDDDDDNDC
jgi:hypothetical protein